MATTSLSFDISQIDSMYRTNTESNTQKKSNGVSKDEFLKLLVTQLKYQDPLNPMDDKEFIGQMAQFSALEQMQNLNASFAATKACNLMGKYIVGRINEGKGVSEISGKVESVKISGSNAYVVVNGQDVPVDSILEVKGQLDLKEMIELNKYTGLLGKNVNSMVKGIEEDEVFDLQGTVYSVAAIHDEPVVILDNVKTQIDSLVLSPEEKEKVTTVKEYLQNNIGKAITAVVIDRYGKKTNLTGVIRSVDGDDVHPQVVFDKVKVMVDSIYEIF